MSRTVTAFSLFASLVSIADARANEYNLWARAVEANGAWEFPGRAQGDPGCLAPCPCDDRNYAQNNVGTSNHYLAADMQDLPPLIPNEVITGVFVNVLGRYNDGTTGRVDLRVEVPATGFQTVLTSSPEANDLNCRYIAESVRDITALQPWDPSLVNSVRLSVRRSGVNTTTLRIKAFRLRVFTTVVPPPCGYSVSPLSVDVGSGGGDFVVGVSTNLQTCSWQAGSNASWIVITSGAAGFGNGRVDFTVQPNLEPAARSGTLSVAGAGVTVAQAAFDCGPSFSVSPSSINAPEGGGDFAVRVETVSPSCPWQAGSNAAWIHITSGASGQGPGNFAFRVDPNLSPSDRSGTVTAAGRTVTVFQAQHICRVSVEPLNLSATADGGSFCVRLNLSSPECEATASSPVPWITITSGATGRGSRDVCFTVPANPTRQARSAPLTVAGLGVLVTQASGECRYSVSPQSISVGPEGGERTIDVTPNLADCEWQATSAVPWATIVAGASGRGSGTVTVFASPNPEARERNTQLAVAGAGVTVTQSAAPCAYSLLPAQVELSAEGGNVELRVGTMASCPWELSSSASWAVLSSRSGSGPRAVFLQVERNTATAARETSITLRSAGGSAPGGSATVSVRQRGSCGLSVSPQAASVPFAGGCFIVRVNAPAGCSWIAEFLEPWIFIDEGTSGSGTGQARICAEENPGSEIRQGRAVVAGVTVTVTQPGRVDASLAVSVKYILDPNGSRPLRGFYATNAQVEEALGQANFILSRVGAPWNLLLFEIEEVAGAARFYNLASTSDVRALEAAARQDPLRYHWREDAINIYVVNDLPAGGVCSFPTRDHIIVINNRRGILNQGGGWLHEVGHFLSLTHTFECFQGGCDPLVCRGQGAVHGEPRGDRTCPDVCDLELSDTGVEIRDTRNVMSYYSIAIEEALFSACQLGEMAFELFDPAGSRSGVLRPPEPGPEAPPGSYARFRRADSNADGNLNISDPVATLGFLFLGQSIPCPPAGDADGDGALNISDAVVTLQHLFVGRGAPIAPPGPDHCMPEASALVDAFGCDYDAAHCPEPEIAGH